MKKLAYAGLRVVACLGVALAIMFAYPPAIVPVLAGLALGYLIGQTRAEVGRAQHDQSGIYGRMDAYRDKDN